MAKHAKHAAVSGKARSGAAADKRSHAARRSSTAGPSHARHAPSATGGGRAPEPNRLSGATTGTLSVQARSTSRHRLAAVILAALLVFVVACAGVLVAKPAFAQPCLTRIQQVTGIDLGMPDEGGATASDAGASHDEDGSSSVEYAIEDAGDTAAGIAEAEIETRTRLIAQCQGVDIYSPIAQADITGILFHQASYEWGQVMTTELAEADLDDLPLRVNNEQTSGEWADADAAHVYRQTDTTSMDTSVDVGAEAGTTVYAPVTGTVIAVIEYDLYDEIDDIQIHIRPDDNEDLDVVLLHQTDALVEAGDRVEGGITPISSVRDIAADLTDIQLSYYTAKSDPGNHSHVQVNDLTNEAYIEKYLKDVEL